MPKTVLHVHAAVDLNNLTADVARHVGSKEEAHVGDVLCLAAATERYLLHPVSYTHLTLPTKRIV